jgi:dihydrofolate reductase/thymidylate synthase
MRRCNVIYAATPSGGIGKDGTLPWKLPSDMAYFARVTTSTSTVSTPGGVRNAVVMGRKTWASIPAKFRPLKGRLNIVLSTCEDVRAVEGIPDDVVIAPSLSAALSILSTEPHATGIESVFVIGGAAAFAEALSGVSGIELDAIYATRILSEADIACDVFVPAEPNDVIFALDELTPRAEENGVAFQFAVYRNRARFGLKRSTQPFPKASSSTVTVASKRHEEWQYLDAIRDICATGVRRGDRTGTGTISKFGTTSRWSLRDNVLPLLTTKRVFWRAVAEELLWFISGDTNAKTLQDKGVKIWDGNASREFLDKTGLSHREVGDLGPVYGFQWRHFGAVYTDMHADYT